MAEWPMKIPCRRVLPLVVLVVASMQALGDEAFNPANAGIEKLRLALDAGRVSSEQLVRYYTDRIERFDQKGPRINTLISLNIKALEEARRLDLEAKDKLHRGMLYG